MTDEKQELLERWRVADVCYHQALADEREAHRVVIEALRERNEITGELIARYDWKDLPDVIL